jgi:hypothetical protein
MGHVLIFFIIYILYFRQIVLYKANKQNEIINEFIWKFKCVFNDCIPKYVVNTNDTLWSVCSIVVDNSGLSGHPNISTMLSQKSVAICHHLSFGDHGR